MLLLYHAHTEPRRATYPDASQVAIKEGKLAQFGVRIPPENDYPQICPFLPEQILDENF